MQAATTLLISGLLLVMAPAVVAATPSGSAIVSPLEGQISEAPTDRAPLGLESGCEVGGDPLSQTGLGEPTFLAVQYCGSCSEDQCRGAIRGSGCKVTTGVWGHCNTFSGAVMSSTGRFNCQCRTGDIP
jgi:hypothetical protein